MPAALGSLTFHPPAPQNIGRTQCFATFLPFLAFWSSFFLLSLSDFSLHCCCICPYVGSLTSKLPSLIKHDHLHAEKLQNLHSFTRHCAISMPMGRDVLSAVMCWERNDNEAQCPASLATRAQGNSSETFSRNQSSQRIPEYPTQCYHSSTHSSTWFFLHQSCPNMSQQRILDTHLHIKTDENLISLQCAVIGIHCNIIGISINSSARLVPCTMIYYVHSIECLKNVGTWVSLACSCTTGGCYWWSWCLESVQSERARKNCPFLFARAPWGEQSPCNLSPKILYNAARGFWWTHHTKYNQHFGNAQHIEGVLVKFRRVTAFVVTTVAWVHNFTPTRHDLIKHRFNKTHITYNNIM